MPIPNSGFLSDTEIIPEQSFTFSDVKVLALHDAQFVGVGIRYGRRWFLKGIRPESADSTSARLQLRKEFEILSVLSHPGIVNFAGIDEVDSFGRCIVTEWIDGDTLEDLLQSGTLTRSDRKKLLYEIIEAVAYIHSKGIVHRDLKPSNIMVRRNGGKAVIVDFGLADTDAFTVLKSPAGTPGYLSERQLTSSTPDTSDDVYALGMIMRSLYPEYRSIIRRCTGNPGRRYRDAAALQRVIVHRNRNRLFKWAAVLVALVAITIALLVRNNRSLTDSVATLENQIAELVQVNRHEQQQRVQLVDSLAQLSTRLEREKRFREENQRHEAYIEEKKRQLKARLKAVGRRYLAESKKPDFKELYFGEQLIEGLGIAKNKFYDEIKPLSEDDRLRLDASFTIYYTEIVEPIFKRHADKER